MPATGTLKHTPKRSKKWRDFGKSSVKQSSTKEHSSNQRSPSLSLNPLENPECFSIRKYCRECNIYFHMPLTKDKKLTGNCGELYIKNRAELHLCPECHVKYLKKQDSLKTKGLLTDIEVEEIAGKRYNDNSKAWFCIMGFIDGYIEMRDNEENILSEL